MDDKSKGEGNPLAGGDWSQEERISIIASQHQAIDEVVRDLDEPVQASRRAAAAKIIDRVKSVDGKREVLDHFERALQLMAKAAYLVGYQHGVQAGAWTSLDKVPDLRGMPDAFDGLIANLVEADSTWPTNLKTSTQYVKGMATRVSKGLAPTTWERVMGPIVEAQDS